MSPHTLLPRESTKSSPLYLLGVRTQSSSPCSQVQLPKLPTRSFQVAVFSFRNVLNDLLGRNHHLDRFAVVHRPITVRNAIKTYGPIEHTAGLDLAFKNVGQKVLDIS